MLIPATSIQTQGPPRYYIVKALASLHPRLKAGWQRAETLHLASRSADRLGGI